MGNEWKCLREVLFSVFRGKFVFIYEKIEKC